MPDNLKKTIACKKCQVSFNVDFSKAPTDVFTLACPKCGQKYQLKKPGTEAAKQQPSAIPPRTAAPASSSLAPSGAPPQTTAGIDLSRFDPRSGWQYDLYRYTRMVPYAKNVTLPIYGSKLVSSIVEIARDQMGTGAISPAAYAAMRANMAATCSTIYSTSIAPELSELGIPRFMQKPFAARFTKSLASELTSSLVGVAASNAPGASIRSSAPPVPSGAIVESAKHAESQGSGSGSSLPGSDPEPKTTGAELAVPDAPRLKGPTPLQHGATPPQEPPPESIQQTSALIARRPVPIAMWILGALMLIACFLPWIEVRGSWNFGVGGRGSMLMGEASGAEFWQGQLCIALLIGALAAKQFRRRGIAGILALLILVLVIHFVLQMAGAFGYSSSSSFMGHFVSTRLRADPSVGSIAILLLSIPFAILAFVGRKPTVQSLVVPAMPVPDRSAGVAPSIEPVIPKPRPAIDPATITLRRKRIRRIGIAAGSSMLLVAAIYGGIELSKRHTLTTAERAQIETWFKPIVSKQDWVVIQTIQDELPELGFSSYKPQVLSDDGYGNVSIELAVALPPYAYDTGMGRFETTITSHFESLKEPQQVHLCNEEPEGQGRQCLTWTIVSPDSMTIVFDDKELWPGTYSIIPYAKFQAHKAVLLRDRSMALIHALDSIAQGTGLIRRGAFRTYACGDECGATFLELRNGQPTPITYLCNNNRFGDVQLSQGDMIGTGDFTNQDMVGREFLIVSKQVNLDGTGAAWAVMGLLPYDSELGSPELEQRFALSANFDAGNSSTPANEIGVPTSTAFLEGSVHDAKDVDVPPSFPGGEQAFFNYLGSNTRYPAFEQDAGIQGIVYLSFVVASDGRILDVKPVRGVSTGLDREAVRVIQGMPRWSPGRTNGRPVNVRFNVPVRFTLR